MKKLSIILTISIFAIAVVIFFSSPAQAAVMRILYNLRWTDGLVGYWSFDGQSVDWSTGTISDLSGSGNHGVVNGGMATGTAPTPGIIGQAMNFDGTANYAVTVDSATLPVGDEVRTLEAWVYTGSGVTDNQAIFGWGEAIAAGETSYLNLYDSKFRFVTIGASGVEDGPQTIQVNTWYHVVATHDGSTTTLYVDGVYYFKNTSSTLITNSSNIYIGSYGWIGAYFEGKIDEVRIYNRALGANEIKHHYDRTAPQFRSKINVTSFEDKWTDGLVGYWSFDGKDTDWSVPAVYDLSGNYATGTPTSMSSIVNSAPGVIGQALKFDGVDDGVSIVKNNSNSSIGSFAAWIKPTGTSDYLYDSRGAGSSGYFLVYSGARGVNSRLRYISNDGLDISDAESMLSQWYYVVVIWDFTNDNYKIYKDAVEVASSDTDYDAATFGSTGMIGERYEAWEGSWSGYKGLIDEVRIYDRVLTPTEIKEYYEQTSKQFPK